MVSICIYLIMMVYLGSGSGRSGSLDVKQAKLTWALIAARCDATSERSLWPNSARIGEKGGVGQRKGYTVRYLTSFHCRRSLISSVMI